MVRIQVKEIEGIIAIVIFISFLTFYLALYRNYIINKIGNYNQINYYNTYINQIINNIEVPYYILSLNLSIPTSMYYQCLNSSPIYNNLINENAYNDFCTSFPIYYPLNIPFLSGYSGVLNNTNNTYLDPNIGLYFYLNITNLTINNQSQYVLLNISNPTNNNTGPINLFITSPVIFYWLQNGDNLQIYNQNSNNYVNFCYQNPGFNCNNINNNAYGVWVNLNIPANSYILLNISPSNNNQATNGNNIFAYYNHQQIDSLYNSTSIKTDINEGNYLVIFNGYSSSYYKDIQIGNCDINVPSSQNIYFYYCNLTQSTNYILLNNVYLNYLVLLYYNSAIPSINDVYQPNITSNFNFIIGPNLTYNFSQYNDLGLTQNGIYNNYIDYGEESQPTNSNIGSNDIYYSSYGYINGYTTVYINGSLYSTPTFQPLYNSLYTSQYEPYYLNYTYIKSGNLAFLYLYNTQNLSIKKIIFSNTYWFIINTQKYYNSENMVFWNLSENNPGFQYGYTNFYNQILAFQYSLLNNYLYYPYENGIILYSQSLDSTSLLFTNYNPITNITSICVNNNQFFGPITNYCNILNLTLLNNYNYENYYLYFYDNPNLDLNTGKYLSFSTQIPILKINYLEPVNVININNLVNISENYQNVYFYFEGENITIYNGTIYQGNIINNYNYAQEYNVYILNNTIVNSLYKDRLIIYIK